MQKQHYSFQLILGSMGLLIEIKEYDVQVFI